MAMDKLPPEILCDILLRNIPHKHDQDVSRDSIHDTSVIRASVLSPLYASHVCRTWRHLSLSCGELWSYLQISVDYESWKCKTKRKRMLEIFDTWLSRTNGYPISYIFHCQLSYGDIGALRGAEYVITTLISQQHRWKDVSFIWCDVEMPPEFPGLVLTNMPMLTSLSLSPCLRSSNGPLHTTISIAKSSKLKSLHLWGDYELDTGNVPIHSLTEPSSLHFQSSSRDSRRDCVRHGIRDCLRFLRVAPNLTEFQLGLPYTSQTPSLDSMTTITVPRLRILAVSGRCSPLIIKNLTLSVWAPSYTKDTAHQGRKYTGISFSAPCLL